MPERATTRGDRIIHIAEKGTDHVSRRCRLIRAVLRIRALLPGALARVRAEHDDPWQGRTGREETVEHLQNFVIV